MACFASLTRRACADHWSLRTGAPFEEGHVSLVLQVEREDGTPAVLTINFPEEETEREPDALRHSDGRGRAAARLRRGPHVRS